MIALGEIVLVQPNLVLAIPKNHRSMIKSGLTSITLSYSGLCVIK